MEQLSSSKLFDKEIRDKMQRMKTYTIKEKVHHEMIRSISSKIDEESESDTEI